MTEIPEPSSAEPRSDEPWSAGPPTSVTRLIPPPATLLKRIWARVPAALCVAVALAAILRLTVRDRWPVVAVLVYVTPPVALAAVLFVAGVFWFFRKEPRSTTLALAASLAFQFWWAASAWVLNPPPQGNPASGTIRGLFWNLRRGAGGWDAVTKGIQGWNPDLAWFVEAEEPAGDAPWIGELQGYETRKLGNGLVVIARGTIGVAEPLSLGPRGRGEVIWVAVKDQTFPSILVDMDSSPLARRREEFEDLGRAIEAVRETPAIVVGDFNTPRDSIHFRALRRDYVNAFETAGRGYDATWPLPFPFLSIDQIWAAGKIAKVRSCELPLTSASDHRPVLVEFTVGP